MTDRASVSGPRRRGSAGITLVELMIVLLIASILVAFAVPSYQQSLQRAKRSDAFAALATTADAQEIVYNNQAPPRTYSDSVAALGVPSTSSDGYYDISISACSGGTLATCYEVRATARDDGPQWQDANCRWMSIDSLGRKRSSPATEGCWRE